MWAFILRRLLLAPLTSFVVVHANAQHVVPSNVDFIAEVVMPAQARTNHTRYAQDFLINRARRQHLHNVPLENSLVLKDFIPAMAEHLIKKQVWVPYSASLPFRPYHPDQPSYPAKFDKKWPDTPEPGISTLSRVPPPALPIVPMHPKFWVPRDKRRTTQRWSDASDGRRRRASLMMVDHSEPSPSLQQESSLEVASVADPDALIKAKLIESIREGAGLKRGLYGEAALQIGQKTKLVALVTFLLVSLATVSAVRCLGLSVSTQGREPFLAK